jgi:DNA-binding transcriptional LysR family regulator
MDVQPMAAYLHSMEWDDLRYFLAVARTGQLLKAALQLGVDPTTVGRRIRRLEKRLEQTLFEQTREGQSLTETGERLRVQVEQIERAARDIEGLPRAKSEPVGLVRVSVSEGFGTWFVAHHLKGFLSAHPKIDVDLAANSGFLSPSRRETDVAILLDRPSKGPLISKKLSDYTLRLYASRAYLAGHREPLEEVADLAKHDLIGYIPDLLYAPELRYLEEIAPGLHLRVRSTSINAQYRIAASGVGVAVLPCFIGDKDPEMVRVIPAVSIARSFWLVTHEDTRQLGRIAAFVDWISATVGSRRAQLLGC